MSINSLSNFHGFNQLGLNLNQHVKKREVVQTIFQKQGLDALINFFHYCTENALKTKNDYLAKTSVYTFRVLTGNTHDRDLKRALLAELKPVLAASEKANNLYTGNKRKAEREPEEHPNKRFRGESYQPTSSATGSKPASYISSSELLGIKKTTPSSSPKPLHNESPNITAPLGNYSAAEKEVMVNILKEQLPHLETKVIYLILRHYYFNLNHVINDIQTGKLDNKVCRDIEKRCLKEEMESVKIRLNQMDEEDLQENLQANEQLLQIEEIELRLNEGDFFLESISLQSEVGVWVMERFFENDPHSHQIFEIKTIQSVQNAKLYDHYLLTQAAIMKRNGGKSNERSLFHGCSANALPSILENGFDIRLSSFKGAAGVGIYFAEFPRTSLSYIGDCPPDEMKILLCRVELGLATTIPELTASYPNATPRNPIRRPQARSELDSTPFDSVNGLMRDEPAHPIHVVYDHYQIYPEYLITFKINENRIIRGQPQTSVVGPTHPRYKAQLEETRKSQLFLTRSINHPINQNDRNIELSILQTLHQLLSEDPLDPTSIHQRDEWNLDTLRNLVRHYNKLCVNYPVLILPTDAEVNYEAQQQDELAFSFT